MSVKVKTLTSDSGVVYTRIISMHAPRDDLIVRRIGRWRWLAIARSNPTGLGADYPIGETHARFLTRRGAFRWINRQIRIASASARVWE